MMGAFPETIVQTQTPGGHNRATFSIRFKPIEQTNYIDPKYILILKVNILFICFIVDISMSIQILMFLGFLFLEVLFMGLPYIQYVYTCIYISNIMSSSVISTICSSFEVVKIYTAHSRRFTHLGHTLLFTQAQWLCFVNIQINKQISMVAT